MSNVSYHISNLLEKMTSTDKDFRFMATNDLMLELQKDSIKLDEDSERKVVTMLLKLLEDKNGEVQNLAVKWLSGALVSFHSSLLSSLLPQLTSPRMAVRKRSILALGHLVPCCSPALFSQLTEHLLTELAKGPPTSMTRTYIQCLATISRQGGHRVGEHLEKLIPMVLKLTSVEDDELREYCFQAFEAFIRRCPKEMSPHVATVTQLCLKFMTFDPNYNYDDEEEEEDSMDIEDGLDEESDDEYSDDDDMSWKVRRSSIKCLEALINTRRDLLLSFYSSICPALLARFKEREENVRADVFAAFSTLLRQTRAGSCHHGPATPGSDSGKSREEEPAVAMLKKQVPLIVKALHRQLKEKSIKSRQGCFCLLTELAHTVPGALEQHIPALIPGIVFSLTDKSTSSTMRIDTLSFFHVLLLSHPPQAFQPHMQVLLPPVVACVEDSFYKITSEALLVAQQLVKVMRPQGQTATAGGFDPKPFIREVFSVTLKRLKATDIDQEVKERAISCMGHMVCHLGDHLRAELQGVLTIFLERLKNEITRLTAVRTVALIAASPLKIDLSSILPEALSVLGSFLRKNQRALKLGTLACLTALVTHHAASIKPAALEPVMCELPALVDENDMHVSQVSVTLLTCMAKACPSSLAKISSSVLAGVFRLVHSPLLQSGALAAILDFLQALVLSKTSNLGYSQLLKSLTDPFHSSHSSADSSIIHRQSYHSVARCVAALSSACPRETAGTVAGLMQEVKSPGSPESARVLALLCLGEVGRSGSLGGSKEVQGVILEAIASTNEEVKTAASCALGGMAVGSLNDYLPFLLKEISSQPRRQYLLLHSLKEVISACPASSLSPHVESIWALLFQNCECQEEGTRNLVAECLGKLTLVNAAQLLPRLRQQLKAGSPLARSTVVTAIKFTIIDQPAPIDSLLKDCIAHNKPSLIRGLLATVLPHLYKETQIRKDLIREVEMGPFKHTVDDGLDVRKAAFECMYTLLDSCLEGLDVLQFLDHVEEGLKDHYDIRMLTFLMLARLASLCPAAVLQRLDRLIEPLKATCTTKVKAGSVKQEFEKQEELRRSAMRAVAALLAVPEVERSPSMADFANQIRTNADMASIYQSVQGGEGGGLGPAESMDMS
ncbi:cullin-associated NEDD8-dissociated protein 2 isoform X2 [Chelmon rostratus]|uniref:cullin-associated NEDD8-dissociated protein 2 isoform X2 n=1 Tax=Chelmon rostratus TaxID=109905 RepID=UPI001BE9C28C|nr:cullin-associated NEDD8-dissociated protein 2 isoform X2 [Chelmon rostratus]